MIPTRKPRTYYIGHSEEECGICRKKATHLMLGNYALERYLGCWQHAAEFVNFPFDVGTQVKVLPNEGKIGVVVEQLASGGVIVLQNGDTESFDIRELEMVKNRV